MTLSHHQAATFFRRFELAVARANNDRQTVRFVTCLAAAPLG